MTRPWPLMIVIIFLLAYLAWGIGSVVNGQWRALIGIIVNAVLVVGLWHRQQWARKWVMGINVFLGSIGIFGLAAMIIAAIRRQTSGGQVNLPLFAPGEVMVLAGTFLCWIPFFLLRRSDVKAWFSYSLTPENHTKRSAE